MREHDHLRRSRLVVISNGINIDRLSGARADGVRAEFGIADDTPLIGVIGRLHPAKGHPDLFAAMTRLRDQGIRPTCLVIGSGDSRSALEDDCRRLSLNEQVVFTGQRSDVPRLLAALDVLAMPSRWEGLPIALLEAMAMSRPIVATRISGIPEVIQSEDNGLLVPPADPVALAEALGRLLSDEQLRERLGRRALQTVHERYDVARTASGYEGLYAEALGLSPHSPAASA
jgi:glycosyltransferase involved in cell wall biosynthesis